MTSIRSHAARRAIERSCHALTVVVPVVLATAARPAAAAEEDALSAIVRTQCAPAQKAGGQPDPCALLDLPRGYAILKDRTGVAQHLLVATAQVSGIEDARLLRPVGPRYWDAAWQARHYVTDRLGRPVDRASLSLAVNSAFGRTQSRLHIHIDCIAPDVRRSLATHAASIGERWSLFPMPLAGHRYRARWVATLDRPDTDPFRLVAFGMPETQHRMNHESILVVGALSSTGEPGFVVLETRANPLDGNRGSAEELQDHHCAIAAAP